MNKFSDEQFIQLRICAEASQILLVAEQNLKFYSRPQRKRFGMEEKNEKNEESVGICAERIHGNGYVNHKLCGRPGGVC